ncbi:FAD-binding oxidoreductase [Frankia sp. R82]|uniref:FAD-binding oxidoreductase n=1 Tax=Frankia sp. R82 TaxID=2950553 RepID=UPI00204309E4|nr:FAD-binding oxidoreductase [Frankia sp. R82]MCM3885391.1 FAD-binding oxidoreductase [Frankia sp. R82]
MTSAEIHAAAARGAEPPHGPAASASAAEPVWWGWGPAFAHHPLPPGVSDLLVGLGIPVRPSRPVALADVRLPAVRLPAAARQALEAVVGEVHVRTDDETRIRHCRGRSTTDLLLLRSGDAGAAPDAVVLPADHDEVLALLRVATRERIVVVPYGGGTSVVGGLAPTATQGRPLIAVDLRRLDRLGRIDRESGTAELDAGLRGPRVEELLAPHGLTLGHVPQSWEYATVGGFAATRSSGQASGGYGRFDEMVVGLRVATPAGSWDLGRAPASAAGPDLRALVLGSEGAFGVITQVTVRVRPLPARRIHEGWWVPDFATGTRLLRDLSARDLRPTVCRLADETETIANLSGSTPTVGSASRESAAAGSVTPGPTSGSSVPGSSVPGDSIPGDSASTGVAGDKEKAGAGTGVGGCRLITGFEGSGTEVADRAAQVASILRAGGATALGPDVGLDWERGRFRAPYLRDALLDLGVFAETLETAGFWSSLPDLCTGVRRALTDTLGRAGLAPVVMCHVSHLYATGASLYFTVVCAQGDDPIGTWRAAKAAAGEAIVAAGGTITHHHAVGTEHRPWLGAEIGGLGLDVLRTVKRTLDPAGILNPGVLVP